MQDSATLRSPSLPAPVLLAILLPGALIVGFISGDSLVTALAAAVALLGLVLFAALPISVPVKLIFALIAVTFLQRVLGYFKLGEVRGLNVGNLLLGAIIFYWLIRGLGRGAIYSPTRIDVWLLFAALVIPILSIFYTTSFRKLPGYELGVELAWYKAWVTPFIYFFLLCQCLERKRDIRLLLYLTLFLVGLAILDGMPQVVKFGNWREGRSEGIVGQANDYATLLVTTAPFLFLILYLLPGRPIVKTLVLGMLGCLALSLLTTYSRAGYAGFLVAFAGTIYIAYRGTRRLPLGAPAIIILGASLLPVMASPQLMESIESRFAPETYKRGKRKSYTRYNVLNQYSGGRLEIWKSALEMAEDYPLFGVGFHAFELELPRYHPERWSNYPHNQFLGALAQGGVVWLTALLILFWKILQFLYQNWRVTLQAGDRAGQIICGGALVSFVIMLTQCMAGDFLNPGPKGTIFWVLMAGAIRYGILSREEPAAISKEAVPRTA